VYADALAAGADQQEALRAVVDRLIQETVQDCTAEGGDRV
jgi:hypothetical protein